MKKKLLFGATMAAVLASCSSDDLSLQTTKQQDAAGVENAVSFEAYSQRSLTRAGYAGVLDNDQLKAQGFGVFGYYTDMNEYDQTSTPNFMYNQKVSGAGWTYSPIKYWPNEYGNKAQSDDVDKLSFFAYAPYTENTPASGKVAEDQVGITGFTRNTAAGDPYVKYVGSLDPTKCVDLCWGVADPNQDVTWNIINGGSQTMAKGMPWMNVQRPQKSLGQKMKFVFKHALSQLNVQIDADVNTNEHGQGAELDANTKVFVRSITFNGFAMKGALNLNNEDAGIPNWKGYNCNNEPIQSEEYTVYDGLKDGKEGTGYTASNEKVTGLNATIIQDKKWGEAAEGVTKTAKNLFNSTTVDAPVYVIPTGDDMNVTIVYDIETKDEKLAGTVSDLETAGVSVENKITKTITVTGGTDALKLEAGKKYTINLHLGLSQVEFEAEVSDWDDSAANNGEAWLPGNGEGPVFVTSITISQDQEALAQNVVKLKVDEVLPSNADDKSVVWKSSDESLATINSSGIVTPATGYDFSDVTTDPAATVYAENTASGIRSNTFTVHVKAATPTGVALSEATVGMFVGANGRAYNSADEASTAGTTAKAWIAADGLAIALNADATLGNSDISWNDFKSQTSDFTTGPAEANISGGTWRWPSKADLDAIDASINAGNYQGCPLESGYVYWSTEEDDTDHAWDLYFYGDNSTVNLNYKDISNYVRVRAVFAY